MNEHLTYHSEIEYWKDVYKGKIKFVSQKDTSVIPWDINSVDPNLPKILDRFDLRSGNLLELGCGTGFDARYLHDRGFKVTALDISEDAIELAKNNTKGSDIDFIVADFFEGFPDKSFDIIYDRGFLHNYKDLLWEIFEKTSAMLNHRGKYILITGNPNQPIIDSCVPPPVFLSEIEQVSSAWFKIVSVEEIIFTVNENYQNSLGYLFFLEKR